MRFLLVILLFLSCSLHAQMGLIEAALMQARSGETVQTDAPQVYTGTPIVSVFPDKPPEKLSGWMDEEKKRLFGTTDILAQPQTSSSFSKDLDFSSQNQFDAASFKQQIITPIGHQTYSVPWFTYTPDFSFIVHVFSNGDVLVEEYIQLMLADQERMPVFTRTLPDRAEILKVIHNNRPISLTKNLSNQEAVWTDSEKLSTGIHNFHILYRLPAFLKEDKNQSSFMLSLTGVRWPFSVERLNALFLFPTKIEKAETQVLFGSNNVLIPDAISLKTDENGNIFLTLKQPLPAFADVKLKTSFESTAFDKLKEKGLFAFLTGFSSAQTVWFLLGAFVCLLLLYLFLSVRLYKKESLPVPSALFLSCLAKTKWSELFFKNLCVYAKETHKRALFVKFLSVFSKHSLLIGALKKIYFFCRMMCYLFKYIVLLLIITGVFKGILYAFDFTLTRPQMIFMIVSEVFILWGFYKFLVHPILMKAYLSCRRIVLAEVSLTGLSEKAITSLFIQQFPYAVAFNVVSSFLNNYTQITGKKFPLSTDL